ncbi:MAG: TonB-dependent receptor [Candidatus Eisenbacteria bacterium]|nr:TonB-dependent receptor [Candidatus Eisenbacteria bacterium]
MMDRKTGSGSPRHSHSEKPRGRARTGLLGAGSLLGMLCGLPFVLFLLSAGDAGAQLPGPDRYGQIRGRITSLDTQEPLPFANVQFFLLEAPDDSTGIPMGGTFAMPPQGVFYRDVPPGDYRLLVSYISYRAKQVTDVQVRPGGTTEVEVALKSAAIKFAPIEVHSTVMRNTEAAVLAQQQRSAAVSDAVSAEQIKKTPDSNAAEALQRVSGLSLVDSRYVFVRGLGERYSATMVNGSPVTSPEPNKRVVPLDLIPAALLDNMFVQKAYTPDQPGEFGGGVVNINTIDFPGEASWSVSVSTGAETGTTGDDFYYYEGGKTDLLGFDDGTRDIPDLVQEMAGDRKIARGGIGGLGFSPQELAEMGLSFNRIWTYERGEAPPHYGFSGSYSNEISILGHPLGFIAGGVFKNSFHTKEHEENSLGPGSEPGTLNEKTAYDAVTSTGKAHLGGVASVSYRVDRHSTLHLRALYNRTAEDETRFHEGINNDHGAIIRTTRLRYIERSILSTNVGMHHVVPQLFDADIEWRVSYSRATRSEPDRRQYTYEWYDNFNDWRVSTRSQSLGFTRLFSELEDSERGADLHVRIPVTIRESDDASVKMGYFYSDKERDFWMRRLSYKTPTIGPDLTMPPESLMIAENIGGRTQQFRLDELTRPTDTYRAGMDIQATYLMVDLPILARLRLVAGARVEDWEQRAITFDQFDPEFEAIAATLSETDVLPAVNLTYALGENTNLRAAYSATISRPDLRELSPFYMEDMDGQYRETGNDSLQRAWIQNYDLRFENYPTGGGIIALSAFYKRMIDPIEKTLWVSSGQPTTQPRNSGEGYLYGTEIEGRLGLKRVWQKLRDYAISVNVSLVRSKAEVGQYGAQTSAERPLAGQSPYVYNLGLYWDPAGRPYSMSLLYNRFGRRLYGVGALGLPDIYEQPRAILDYTLRMQLGRWKMKFVAENLLDSPIDYEQIGYTVRHYRNGRGFSLSVSTSGS